MCTHTLPVSALSQSSASYTTHVCVLFSRRRGLHPDPKPRGMNSAFVLIRVPGACVGGFGGVSGVFSDSANSYNSASDTVHELDETMLALSPMSGSWRYAEVSWGKGFLLLSLPPTSSSVTPPQLVRGSPGLTGAASSAKIRYFPPLHLSLQGWPVLGFSLDGKGHCSTRISLESRGPLFHLG